MEVKHVLSASLMALVLGLSSCNAFFPAGKDGKVYLSLTKDSTAYLKNMTSGSYEYMPVDSSYLSFNELPSSISYGTPYEISSGSGTYYGHYTMYAYSSNYYFYDYSSSSSSQYGELVYSPNEPGEDDSFDFTYTVEANKGSSGFLSGKNGEDVYYNLYLAFDPYYFSLAKSSSVGGKAVALPSTTSVDASGKITKVFSDTDYTVTVVTTPKASKAEMPLSDIRPVEK